MRLSFWIDSPKSKRMIRLWSSIRILSAFKSLWTIYSPKSINRHSIIINSNIIIISKSKRNWFSNEKWENEEKSL